jgi:hypothetical protein
MKVITSVLLSVVFPFACNSFAKDAPASNPFITVLAEVPAAELPAKAADVVSQAKRRERKPITVNVVKAALSFNPAAAPAIVGAIARAVPEMASIAAGTAAVQQPKQASAIAKAAAAGAPSQAGAVVKAVCLAVPSEYREIAAAVSHAVPGASKEILKAVVAALPDLKPSMEKVLAGYGGNVPSVDVTLDEVALAKAQSPSAPSAVVANPYSSPVMAGSTMARGPASGPAYIPLTRTPTNVNSGTSGPGPGGGRNYAAP